jgi:hypothetical protein
MACAVAAEDTAAEAEHGHVEVERGVAAAWSEGEAHPSAAWFTLSVFFCLSLSGKGRGEEGATYRILAGCSSLRRPSRCRSRGHGGDDGCHRRRLRGMSWARRRRLGV